MRAVAILALTLVATTCTCGTLEPADSGLDTGSGEDAPDSPRDTGHDAPDIGMDTGPDDPEWVALEGYPADCNFAWARHPERLFTPDWVGCDGVASCQWLAPDGRYVERAFWGENMRYHDGTIGYFATSLTLGPRGSTTTAVLTARSEGSPIVAVRVTQGTRADGTFCGDGPGTEGPGLALTPLRMAPDGTYLRHEIIHGTYAEFDGALPPSVFVPPGLLPPFSVPQEFTASETTTAFVVQPIGHVIFAEESRWQTRSGPDGLIHGEPNSLTLHGRDAFWMSWYEGATGNEVWLVHSSIDEPEEMLVRVPDTKLWGLAVNDEQLCWIVETSRTPEGRPDRGDLYCSPYTTDAMALAPRLVHTAVQIEPVGVIGSGLYAQVVQDRTTFSVTLEVFEIATGAHRTCALPPDWRQADDALWVTAREIAFPLASPRDTVVRIGLDAFEIVP